MRALRRGALLALVLAAVVVPAASGAFDLGYEARNYSKTNERFQQVYGGVGYQAALRKASIENQNEFTQMLLSDPERKPVALCSTRNDGCAGDVRFYDWNTKPGNVRVGPILWTARSGATISGHVWATRSGPAKKPGIVITNGSVQAPEQLYWPQAAALAKAGYVVLTWDPQTQGYSDTPGEAPTATENATPQSEGAFTNGTVDALDFFLSTPSHRFRPRNSATMPNVSHAGKQARRVKAGLDAAYNPLWARVDPRRIGIAGHSLGALAVSKVASADRRVKAVVAWDQLKTSDSIMGASGTPIPPRIPALSMSGDYGIGSPGGAAGVNPKPYTSQPDPQGANAASHAFSKKGLPTGQINTRGGTHFDYSFIPNPAFGATYRGIDQVTWYTIAWFQKYLKHASNADRLLLTNRWQRDTEEGRVDPDHDANVYSRYLRSRIDIRRSDRSRALCEDVRKGCGILVDDLAGPFSALDYAYGRDSLAPRRKVRCASSIRSPRRLDLSRSHRRLRIRLRLTDRTRVKVGVRRGHQRRRTGRRFTVLRRSGRGVTVRLKRRARAGRYRTGIRLRCTQGVQRKKLRLKVKR